jgi:ion channel-forming bestrophin family protein
MLYAVKNHLRAEWGSSFSTYQGDDASDAHSIHRATKHSFSTLLSNAVKPPALPLSPSSNLPPSYTPIVTQHFTNLLHRGLSLPLSITITLERHINYMQQNLGLAAPLAGGLSNQLGTLTNSFSAMETIRLTPLPVAHLIHTKQVLALYCCVLPFAMVRDMGYWAIPIACMVCFTLYGIEGIGRQLEDPFGRDRNDIRMDDIVEDVRVEVEVMLDEWRKGQDWFADSNGTHAWNGGDSGFGGDSGEEGNMNGWRQGQGTESGRASLL